MLLAEQDNGKLLHGYLSLNYEMAFITEPRTTEDGETLGMLGTR